VVDEANLKVSNTPTNGYFLSAQSGNTGGLTWAEAASGADLYAAETTGSSAPSAGGTRSLAIGSGASSAGSEAIAIGVGADGQGGSSVAIGDGAVAGAFSVSIGYGTADIGPNNTLIGRISSSTYRQQQTIIGHDADGGDYQIGNTAVGYGAKAMASYSTALGKSYASGTDSFAAAISTSTSSYGATGANSVAIGKTNKAQSTCSSAVGGSLNIASDTGATVTGGYINTASGLYSRAGGRQSKSDKYGKDVWASGQFSAQGDAQSGTFVLRNDTTDATPEALTADNGTAGTTNQVILPNNSAYAFHGTIVARQKASEGTASAAWKIEGLIRREGSAGTTVLVNSATTILDNTPAWGMALSADTTNGGLKIEVTGEAATNIRWVATINTSEVTYA